jgi:hypothetical protein
MKWIINLVARLLRQSSSGDSGAVSPMERHEEVDRTLFPEHIIIFAIFLVNVVAVILQLFR